MIVFINTRKYLYNCIDDKKKELLLFLDVNVSLIPKPLFVMPLSGPMINSQSDF